MSEFNIEVPAAGSVRLPTGGKYCDRDIIVKSLAKVPMLTYKNIYDNGTYTPPAGYDGFESVTVNVPKGEYTAFGTMKGYTFSMPESFCEVPFDTGSGRAVVTIRLYTEYEFEVEMEFFPYTLERNDDGSIRDTWLSEYLAIKNEKIAIYPHYMTDSYVNSCTVVVSEFTVIG